MPVIIPCNCGAKLRLPDESTGRLFRCPRCRAEVHYSLPEESRTSPLPQTGPQDVVCPICQSLILENQPIETCRECQQVHHRECWQEVGGCSTYGCKKAPVVEKQAPAGRPRSAWGDTKTCPVCGETIKAIALRCRFCDTEFDTVDPLTRKDLRRLEVDRQRLNSTRITVVTLFVVSVIGCLAPLALLLNLILLAPRQKEIKQAGPLFMVLAHAGICLSFFYCLLIVVFVIMEFTL